MTFYINSVPARAEGPLRAVLLLEGTDRFDPFLVLHEQGSVTYSPGEAIGCDDHPHRGFETVNYLIGGEQYHRDLHAHEGGAAQLGPQALTAGHVVTSRERRSRVALGAGERGFEALVLTALPIGEHVISEGPFVMTRP